MRLKLTSLLLLTSALGCAAEPLRLELKRVEKKTAECVSTFEYPEIISAASPAARDRVNAGILRVLMRTTDYPGRDSGFRSLDAYADAFLKTCEAFQKGPSPRALYEHKRVTIFRSTPPVLSFRCDADEDGGGAHPFGTTFFVNFEESTGKPIAMADLLKEGARPKLESIAKTRLNDNFGIGQNDLLFYFNTYEIGPGAMGPTEVKLSFRQIHDLLKIDLPAW